MRNNNKNLLANFGGCADSTHTLGMSPLLADEVVMKVRLFDLKNAPAFQGETIKEIHSNIRGKLIAAGEIEPRQNEWKDEDSNQEDQAFYVYLKTAYKNGEVESVWRCNGVTVECAAVKYPQKDWEKMKRTA